MRTEEKREIVERVVNRIYREYYRHADEHEVQETLDAANYFKLRKAAETALTELRAYRRLNGVVPALNVVDGPVERELEAALEGGGGE